MYACALYVYTLYFVTNFLPAAVWWHNPNRFMEIHFFGLSFFLHCLILFSCSLLSAEHFICTCSHGLLVKNSIHNRLNTHDGNYRVFTVHWSRGNSYTSVTWCLIRFKWIPHRIYTSRYTRVYLCIKGLMLDVHVSTSVENVFSFKYSTIAICREIKNHYNRMRIIYIL